MLRHVADQYSAGALEGSISPRDGTLTLRYAPTWIGVREYREPDGSISRELHRPEQVWSPGFLATIKRLCAPIDHPSDPATGAPVWVHVDAGEVDPPPGYVLRTPREVAAGWTGDAIEPRKVDGIEVPTVQVTVTDRVARDRILAGFHESSLGYDTYIDRTPGVWVAPDGSEHPYDAEHVLDPEDPRIASAVAAGALTPAQAARLGANHFAIAIARGRGGKQSELRLDSCAEEVSLAALRADLAGEIPLREDLAEPRRFYFLRNVDVHGKSGTGLVADGIQFGDGRCAIRWRTETASTTLFDSAAELDRIHGHGGKSAIIWVDPEQPAPQSEPAAPAPDEAARADESESVGAVRADTANGTNIGAVSKVKIHIPSGPLRKCADAAMIEVAEEEAALLERLLTRVHEAMGMAEAQVAEAQGAEEAAKAMASEAQNALQAMEADMEGMKSAAEMAAAKEAEMVGDMEKLKSDRAALAAKVDRFELSLVKAAAKRMGLTPTADTASAAKAEIVKAKAPAAVDGIEESDALYGARVDAAFKALEAGIPAAAPKADAESHIPTGLTPLVSEEPAARRVDSGLRPLAGGLTANLGKVR